MATVKILQDYEEIKKDEVLKVSNKTYIVNKDTIGKIPVIYGDKIIFVPREMTIRV